MKMDYRILYLEDREEEVGPVADLLRREYLPAGLAWVRGQQAFQNALKEGWSYDVLLVADPLAGFSGQDALTLAKRRCPNLPVILLIDQANAELAAEYLRQGAAEVVARSGLALLAPAVRRALREARGLASLREAEAENARLASLLRTVLESTSEGILVVDLAGRIATYNRKFMSLCGIPEYVMAPMDLERVLRFLQDQFADPETFLSETRALGDRAERRALGFLVGKDQRTIEAYGRSQRMGKESVGKVFSFVDVTERDPAHDPMPETLAVPPDLMEAARAGRVVPWYLTEEELVVSDKGLALLGLPLGGLPRDLAGLEALIHPEDLDRFRRSLEHPRTAPFELRMRKGDGSWIATRWNMKKGAEGYRGVFSERPGRSAPGDGQAPEQATPSFNFKVQVLQD
ncbi:MAG: PAS-domain containing protein [Holophaga sp.]|nr:PAS-domain containing protein [Holophaga sp.]